MSSSPPDTPRRLLCVEVDALTDTLLNIKVAVEPNCEYVLTLDGDNVVQNNVGLFLISSMKANETHWVMITERTRHRCSAEVQVRARPQPQLPSPRWYRWRNTQDLSRRVERVSSLYHRGDVGYTRELKGVVTRYYGPVVPQVLELSTCGELCRFPFVPHYFAQLAMRIMTCGVLRRAGVFRVPGRHTHVNHVPPLPVEELDDDDCPSCFKRFLREMPCPVLCPNPDTRQAFLRCTRRVEIPKCLLRLPAMHKCTLFVVLQVLDNVLKHSDENCMNIDALCSIFSAALFEEPNYDSGAHQDHGLAQALSALHQQQLIVRCLLENVDEVRQTLERPGALPLSVMSII